MCISKTWRQSETVKFVCLIKFFDVFPLADGTINVDIMLLEIVPDILEEMVHQKWHKVVE